MKVKLHATLVTDPMVRSCPHIILSAGNADAAKKLAVAAAATASGGDGRSAVGVVVDFASARSDAC